MTKECGFYCSIKIIQSYLLHIKFSLLFSNVNNIGMYFNVENFELRSVKYIK